MNWWSLCKVKLKKGGVVYKQSNDTNETDSGSTLLCQLWPTTEKNTGAI